MKTENFDKNPWNETKAKHQLWVKLSEIELLDKVGLVSGLKKLFDFRNRTLENSGLGCQNTIGFHSERLEIFR